MQYTQNANSFAHNSISHKIGCVLDDQFSCAFDASGTTHLRELEQPFHLFLDPVIHDYSGLRTVSLDVIEDRIAVIERESGPFQPHRSPGLTE